MEWNADLYLRFEAGRTRPSVDLAARIDLDSPSRIIDIGCGPGNSTAVLARRWPGAEVIGVDSSESMLSMARATDTRATWVQADATTDLSGLGTFDVVFSNAMAQWVPNQEALLQHMFALVRPGGVLAVQIPNAAGFPIQTALITLLTRWHPRFAGVASLYSHGPAYYYDVLSALTNSIDLWVTDYLFAMPDHHALVEFYSGSALRPYLERLNSEEDQQTFLAEYRALLVEGYSPQPDGNILFGIHRIFAIARNT